MRFIRRFFMICIIVLAPYCVFAEDIYVANSSVGGNTGADCTNAHSVSWFNTIGNWGDGAGKISAGDTVHFCGTLISPVTVQGNGTPGNPITMLFEPNTKFSVPTLNDNGVFINASYRSYITIDGGTNGLIEVTNNGTGLGYQRSLYGISAEGVSNFIVKNMTIKDLYKRTPFSADGNRFGIGLNLSGSYITVQNCTLTGGDTMVAVSYGTGTNKSVVIRNNAIGQCNHGITIGAYQVNSYLDDVVIANNRINDLDVWEGNSGLHLDGIIIFNESSDSSGAISNLQIYGNYIGPNIGNTNTAAVFIIAYKPSQAQNVNIYNNLFTSKPPYYWTNGFITASGNIYNNTIVALAGGTGVNVSNNSNVKNNIIYQTQSGGCTPVGIRDLSTIQIDNNLYYCNGPLSLVAFNSTGNALFYGYSQWKSVTGYDAKSIVADPQFVDIANGDFRLTSTSPGIGAGVNLGAQYAIDKNGIARPQSSAWDIGAYQSGGPGLVAPGNLRLSN